MKITLKHIPALFPNIDFTDIRIVECREIRVTNAEVSSFVTENAHKRVDYPLFSRKQKVQSLFYPQYYFEFYVKELENIPLFQCADFCRIETDQGEIFDTFDVTAEIEKVEDTFNFKVTIKFKLIKSDEEVINNYLCNDFILEKFGSENLYKIVFHNSKQVDTNFVKDVFTATISETDYAVNPTNLFFSIKHNNSPTFSSLTKFYGIVKLSYSGNFFTKITKNGAFIEFSLPISEYLIIGQTIEIISDPVVFYTPLIPIESIENVRLTELEDADNPRTLAYNSQKFKTKIVELYLTEPEKNSFDYISDCCDFVTLFTPDNFAFQHIGTLKTEVEEIGDLIDVYKRNVKIRYKELNFNHYGV